MPDTTTRHASLGKRKRECKHPPERVYCWAARDDRVPGGRVMCAACCDCGKVLAGDAD